jgi:hypothetical protein
MKLWKQFIVLFICFAALFPHIAIACVPTPDCDCKDGKDGENGKDGLDGKNGDKGDPGKDGLNGKDGLDGKNGDKGDPGKDGSVITIERTNTISTDDRDKRIDDSNVGLTVNQNICDCETTSKRLIALEQRQSLIISTINSIIKVLGLTITPIP